MLSREEIKTILSRWYISWNEHNLDSVMELFHDEALFENWTGTMVKGKEAIRRAWGPWFKIHGEFRFKEEDTFIDEIEQKVLYRWQLKWPSIEKGYTGMLETRRGVDILNFRNGKIIRKLTYSKTTIEIGEKKIRLAAEMPSSLKS
jgi:hypothetical protein